MEKIIECPYGCKDSTFEQGYSTTTLAYVPTIINERGEVINEDDVNVTTTKYTCQKCGGHFEIRKKGQQREYIKVEDTR